MLPPSLSLVCSFAHVYPGLLSCLWLTDLDLPREGLLPRSVPLGWPQQSPPPHPQGHSGHQFMAIACLSHLLPPHTHGLETQQVKPSQRFKHFQRRGDYCRA
jgi:hypothetical protein